MKIAIVGGRDFGMRGKTVNNDGISDFQHLTEFIDNTLNNLGVTDEVDTVISGGAKGADYLGECYADVKGLKKEIYYAHWEKFGKSAGFMRNIDIIQACDICFAFWDGQSKGTKNDIDLCKKHNKPCYIFPY